MKQESKREYIYGKGGLCARGQVCIPTFEWDLPARSNLDFEAEKPYPQSCFMIRSILHPSRFYFKVLSGFERASEPSVGYQIYGV